MDGIHDLGGREGFGRVDADEKEEAFHSDWEARAYAIVRAMTKAPGWTLDRFRFTREQIDPADYLTRPYYDQWLQSYAALMVESGVADVDEIATGKAKGNAPEFGDPARRETVAAERMEAGTRFDRNYDKSFSFSTGEKVKTREHVLPGHTRLPGYVRGHRGVIVHVRGAFVLPDDAAKGTETAQPLYTVAFDADDLWPDEGHEHLVNIDLWESYLEPA